MKILREVKIVGLRSVERLELILSDLNVVIGANKLEKSNLNEVFRLLQQVQSHDFQTYAACEPDRLEALAQEV